MIQQLSAIDGAASQRRFAMREKRVHLLVVVAVLLVFSPLIRAEFLTWDDWYNLSHNPWLNPPTWATVAHYWKSPAYGLYIPVTYTLWTALAALGFVEQADPCGVHLNPYLYHAANIAVHLMATLAVYRIFLKIAFSPAAACVGALVFGLHPVQVEAVAWTAGMKDLLAGGLGLFALLIYLQTAGAAVLLPSPPHLGERGRGRGVLREGDGEKNKDPLPCPLPEYKEREAATRRFTAQYLLATICVTLAMLAKPSAMVVPVMALAIDRIVFRRHWRAVLRACGPWLLLSVACAIVARLVQPAIGVTPAPLWQRPLIVADSIQFYLGRLLWPQWLGIDYGRTPAYLAASGQLQWTKFLPLIGSLFTLVFADRKMWLGAALFLIALAPTSGAVTFLYQYYSTVADHYLYLPMFGVALAVAQIFTRVRRTFRPFIVMVIVALAVRSFLQARYWKDDWSLFERSLRVNPRSFQVWDNLGQALLNADNAKLAEKVYRQSIAVKSDDVQARTRLAELLELRGERSEASHHRRAALFSILNRPPEVQQELLPTLKALVKLCLAMNDREAARNYQAQAERLAPADPGVMENASRLAAP